MPIVGEAVHSVFAAQIPFAELAFVIEGDLFAHLEEWREVCILRCLVYLRWFGDEEVHLRGGDRHACRVIKLNEV